MISKEVFLIFPNQLFENNKYINKNTIIYLIEHEVFFTMYNYHKMKLVLHRSSMKWYSDYLKNKYKCKINYVEFNKNLEELLINKSTIKMYDPVDHFVVKNIKKICKKNNINLIIYDSPCFLTKNQDLKNYMDNNTNSTKFNHYNFYIWQRKRLSILVNKNNKPINGKWTFDSDNRLPFPKDYKETYNNNNNNNNNNYIKEAIEYINKYFNNNPGDPNLYLPITHNDTKKHFKIFLKKRLKCFGDYQDAVRSDILFGCHSVMSPMLNIGLITPQYMIKKALDYGVKYKIPLHSLEGYIRQIIGWREYCKLVYMFMFIKKNINNQNNYFNNHRTLNKKVWYKGNVSTGIVLIDNLINKTLKYSYLHHIERLMYIGNFMLISEINPNDVFEWFQSMFIDSYHVFMYPNVYGMSQHSIGPIMMKRPYFSSSNYINKMSNYHKNNNYSKIVLNDKEYNWFDIWDSLYYNFIYKNKKILGKNYATAAQVMHLNKKSKNKIKKLRKLAKMYLNNY